jgi:hypothetical protein
MLSKGGRKKEIMVTVLDWVCGGTSGSSSGSASASSKPFPSSPFCLLLCLKTASIVAARLLEVFGGTISRLTLLDLDMFALPLATALNIVKVALDRQTFYCAWSIR